MKSKQLLRLVVVAGLSGATAFCLYKAWKIAKEYREEEAARQSLEDDVRLSKQLKDVPVDLSEDEPEPLREAPVASEGHSTAYNTPVTAEEPKWTSNVTPVKPYLHKKKKNSLDDPSEPDPEEEETGIYEDPEEVTKLRFPPSSDAAFNQYVEMKLADLENGSNEKEVLKRLFEVRFEPQFEEDGVVLSHIIESRGDFFGDESTWVEWGSIAEVLIFFAEQADFDLDGGIGYWLISLVQNYELKSDDPEDFLDEFGADIERHSLCDEKDNYGIWLLKPSEKTSANEGLMQQYWDFCGRIMAEEDQK